MPASPLNRTNRRGPAARWLVALAVVMVAVAGWAAPAVAHAVLQSTSPPRYSQWALGAVLAVAVSGGLAAWRQVGSLSAVTTTRYGRLLIAKTVIFAVLIGVASTSRRLVHGGLALPFGLGRPAGRRAALEGPPTPPPAGAAPANGAGGNGAGGNGAQPNPPARPPVPASAGSTAVAGTADAATRSPGGPPSSTGHFAAYGFDVPLRGTWRLQMTVRTSEVDEVYADPVTVRIR